MGKAETEEEAKRRAEAVEALTAAVANAQNLRFDACSRTIYLWADIDQDSIGQCITTLMTVDQTPGDIRLVLSSCGGDSHDGLALYDAIRAARNDVTIDVYGNCYSIASIILQAGDLRRLSKNVEFMIHNGHLHIVEEARESAEGLTNMGKQLARIDLLLQGILAKHSGNTIKTIQKWTQQDFFLTAAQAVRLGFADEIIKETR
jgi:ATP-dependent Clp protease, protease subunit